MEHNHPPNQPNRVDVKDPIERLLKFAGSRPQPDSARKAEFKSTLHAEWHRVTEQSPQRRTFGWAAAMVTVATAAIVLAVAPFWRNAPQPAATVVLGRVVRSEGVVRSMPASGTSSPERSMTVGDEIRTDTLIETPGDGRAAVALDGGISLRLDVGTRVAMVGERVLRLDRGAVYVDSGTEKNQSVRIHTENGDVRDIGTQFEVRMESASLQVRVREGEVIVDRRGAEMTARSGEALRVDRHGGHVRSTVPVFGPEWEWTTVIAPQFQLEGSTVQQFLEWVSREQGWRWRFVDTDTARRAAGIVTHGSIEGYTPEEALAIVLPTCGLSFVRNRDEVIVSFLKESSPRGQ